MTPRGLEKTLGIGAIRNYTIIEVLWEHEGQIERGVGGVADEVDDITWGRPRLGKKHSELV